MNETRKQVVAYAMVQGNNSMQYKVMRMVFEDGIVVEQEQIGTADLKPVVLGRLIKLLTRI